jgi:hypothetical protein
MNNLLGSYNWTGERCLGLGPVEAGAKQPHASSRSRSPRASGELARGRFSGQPQRGI